MTDEFVPIKRWRHQTSISLEKQADIVFLRALAYIVTGTDVCGAVYYNDELLGKVDSSGNNINPLLIAWNGMSESTCKKVKQVMFMLKEYACSQDDNCQNEINQGLSKIIEDNMKTRSRGKIPSQKEKQRTENSLTTVLCYLSQDRRRDVQHFYEISLTSGPPLIKFLIILNFQ